MGGFFDGEGCIGLYVRNKERGAFSLQVTVSQVDTAVLDLFAETFPGGSCSAVGERVTNLTWYGKAAGFVVAELFPYLRVKAAQAELALEWKKYSDAHKPGYPFLPATKERIKQIAQELRDLKHNRDDRGI
jgi:hypothetical protein